ncbi:hypothetical protein K4A83_18320 [Spirulina subsalsa FACHB-351]|uniref:Flagellar assembly protein H n=1 Tax=Spirulina subsalsa FACHB-351 TaxID=234711 RepID=A0ABT3L9L5_9CYAN|nr:hypothetical protein [Spirulina subsalsa]MCW6038212.1 hypothetical protein [Spirulina subsalsa FACHB-351]
MTRFLHDQFAKDYLEELLTPYGTIQSPRRIPAEVREVDLWFSPHPEFNLSPDSLGILARAIETPALFEPFRNPATPQAILDCLVKLVEINRELQRDSNRQEGSISPDTPAPRLWILTPTASRTLLSGFGATLDLESWPMGVYFLPPTLRTMIVAIHQLPRTPETLWLRILGRGRVQTQAIQELEELSPENPFRGSTLMALNRLKAHLDEDVNPNWEDRELIMRLSPLFDQQLEAAKLSGLEQGLERGERLVVENLLQFRFGSVDAELAQIIEAVLSLPASEFTPLLMQLSREELIERFGGASPR